MGLTFKFDDWNAESDPIHQDTRPLTEKSDPLALSWAAYHVWTKFPNRRWADWDDVEAHDHDRAMANATRKYYRDQLAIRALKSQTELTKFSRDLYEICNGGIMRHCHKGMLCKLPYFYVEDTARTELQQQTQHQPALDRWPRSLSDKRTRTLARYGKIFHTRRNRETMEYWTHDKDSGEAVMWSIAFDNPLRSLVEHYWNNNETFDLHARWHLGHDRGREFKFWVVAEPELRFDQG